jgi:hypothetical protein
VAEAPGGLRRGRSYGVDYPWGLCPIDIPVPDVRRVTRVTYHAQLGAAGHPALSSLLIFSTQSPRSATAQELPSYIHER